MYGTSAPTDYLQVNKEPPFQFQEVDEFFVSSILCSLDAHKATGLDHIPPLFLRRFHSFLARPITLIVNRSLTQSVIPTIWKQAKVIWGAVSDKNKLMTYDLAAPPWIEEGWTKCLAHAQ